LITNQIDYDFINLNLSSIKILNYLHLLH